MERKAHVRYLSTTRVGRVPAVLAVAGSAPAVVSTDVRSLDFTVLKVGFKGDDGSNIQYVPP